MSNDLKLGLQLGYWGAMAPGMAHVELAKEAENLGYEVVILNGKNIENLRAYLDGESFIGTIIK